MNYTVFLKILKEMIMKMPTWKFWALWVGVLLGLLIWQAGNILNGVVALINVMK